MMSTLKSWNEKYTSTDGKQYKLDINVAIDEVEFTNFTVTRFHLIHL